MVLYAGFYNVAATEQHFAATVWLLKTGLRESVERRARRIEVPPLDDPALRQRGLKAYHAQCAQCHGTPGVAPVGPSLERMATRELIAGVIANNQENMVKWLREPQKLHPRTTMPDLGVTERDARDIAAYLYTLR